MAGRPAIGAVFLREARRSARRWQTYALRAGFASALFALPVAVSLLESGRLTDPAESAKFGRTLFLTYAYTQVGIVAILAPLLVGLGVAEERDEGTLQLLIITKLSTFQILWGKIISRLLVLTSFVLGGLPVLALIGTFGGVGVWEIPNATFNTLLVALVLGTIGGVAALFSGGGAAALVVALIWAVFAWGIVPLSMAALMSNSGSNIGPNMALLSPPAAMLETSWRGFAATLTNLPVVFFVARLATPLFALVTSRSAPTLDGDLTGDPELAQAARVQRRVGIIGLLVPLFSATALAIYTLRQMGTWHPKSVPFIHAFIPRTPRTSLLPLLTSEIGTGVYIGTAILILMVSAGLIVLIQLRITALLKQAFGGREGTSGILIGTLRLFDTAIRPMRLPVWPSPIARREVMTRGLGGPSVFARWLLLPMLAFASFSTCLGIIDGTGGQIIIFFGAMGWMLGMGITVLVATTAYTSERQARTLPLLITTTHGPIKTVLGKLVAASITTLPWVGTGIFMLVLGRLKRNVEYGNWGYGYAYEPYCAPSLVNVDIPGLEAGVLALWAFGVWALYLTTSMLVAMRARPARLAFGINICLAIAFPVALVVLPSILEVNSAIITGLIPIFDVTYKDPACGPSWASVISGPLWLGLSLVPLVVLMVRYRAWVLADD